MREISTEKVFVKACKTVNSIPLIVIDSRDSKTTASIIKINDFHYTQSPINKTDIYIINISCPSHETWVDEAFQGVIKTVNYNGIIKLLPRIRLNILIVYNYKKKRFRGLKVNSLFYKKYNENKD